MARKLGSMAVVRGLAGAVVAACAALSSGCGQDAGHDAGQLSAATVESFRLLMYQPRDLALAEHRLIQRCMRTQGFQYPARVPDPGVGSASLLKVPPRFTVEQARAAGYGDTLQRQDGDDPGESTVPGNPLDSYVESLAPEDRTRFRRALDDPQSTKVTVSLPGGASVGAPSGGCRAEARLSTYGSMENYLTIAYLPQMAQSHVTAIESDRTLQQAMQRYARCMADSGYRAENPTAAIRLAESYYVAGGSAAAARQQEITLAVQDATCQESVRIYDEYQAAVNRVAAQWISDNEAAVLAAADAQRRALDNARKILREGA